jgi:hypothetical protein
MTVNSFLTPLRASRDGRTSVKGKSSRQYIHYKFFSRLRIRNGVPVNPYRCATRYDVKALPPLRIHPPVLRDFLAGLEVATLD